MGSGCVPVVAAGMTLAFRAGNQTRRCSGAMQEVTVECTSASAGRRRKEADLDHRNADASSDGQWSGLMRDANGLKKDVGGLKQEAQR